MYTYEDFKKAPIGTKITFEKGEILVKDYYEMFENNLRSRTVRDLENLQDNRYSIIGEINSEYDLNRIIKIEEPVYTTVYEVKDILDEKEKEYLSNVIRPFRNRFDYIFKHRNLDSRCEHIVISLDDENNDISFPTFEIGTMYKGMEFDREYSLEELGL